MISSESFICSKKQCTDITFKIILTEAGKVVLEVHLMGKNSMTAWIISQERCLKEKKPRQFSV